MLTGYTKFLQENFNIIYEDLVYYQPNQEFKPLSKKIGGLIGAMREESKEISDGLFNYYEIIKFCIDKYYSNELDMLEYTNNNNVFCATFLYPEKYERINKPTILIDTSLLDSNSISLIVTSTLRAMKQAKDYFSRVDNNVYTDWDEVENILYLLDAYYVQARFIDDFVLSRNYGVSKFEYFISTSYKEDTLRSLFMYYYGIDRDLFINSYFNLTEFIDNKITIEELISAYEEYTDFTNIQSIDNEQEKIELSSQLTIAVFYKYFLNHYKITERLETSDIRDRYKKLITKIDNIIIQNREYLERWSIWVQNYQENETLMQ